MNTNEKACLVEGVLDGLDNYSELTNRVASAAIVAAIEAVEAEEKDPEEDEEDDDEDDCDNVIVQRDQAVAELNKVQKELDDIRQNGGNERVEKLLKAKISVWEQEYEERIKYLKELNDKTIQDLVSRSKELDDAKWDIAQLHKELAHYRPKPEQDSTCAQMPVELQKELGYYRDPKPEEAKP